jgi:hypothetical protein
MIRSLRLLQAVIAALIACTAGVSCARHETTGSSSASAAAASPEPDARAVTEKLPSVERKLIRTAELGLRVKTPAHALEEARAIAEQFGGHVVSSNAHAPREPEGEAPLVTVSLKVKADRFDDALRALRRLGRGSGTETVSTQDVTEEAADLDARIRTQKRLEEQFLAILKEAKSVADALAVQRELGQVRGEIERLEGKQRLLDDQVALSTITVRFEQDEPLVALSGGRFGRAVSRAGADALNVGAAIVIGTIRLAGALVPIVILILLPLGLGLRWLLRRLMPCPRAPATT